MKHQMLKDVAAVVVVVCLLPYVVTVLVAGVPKKSGKEKLSDKTDVTIVYDDRSEKMPLQQYFIGVLASQMSVEYEMEALKAQAVLVRTDYEKNQKDQEVSAKEQTFLSMEQMKDLWQEHFEENYQKLERAVVDTKGICMYYNNALAQPYYHAISAGKSRNGAVLLGNGYEYLGPVTCEKDYLADSYVTIKTITKKELCEKLTQYYEGKGIESADNPAEICKVVQKDSAGYVEQMEVAGQSVHGETFRKQFLLPSGAFEVEPWEDGLRFVCKGLGHGLGMSLYGANELAKNGKDYQQILNYFFKDIAIE